jgi:hypothetical protein
MRLRLDARWTEQLNRIPESGMGYQRVSVQSKNGRIIERATVLNAEYLEIADPAQAFEAADIVRIDLAPAPQP